MLISLLVMLPIVGVKADDVSYADAPILSKELPSYSNLQREKRSIATTQVTSVASPLRLTASVADDLWDDNVGPPTTGSGDNNMGAAAPVGDVSLVVVVLAIAIYSVYRGASTSRRRNNF